MTTDDGASPDDNASPADAFSTDLARAVEHSRILRGAGDAAGAAHVLDQAFDAEGSRAGSVSERLRFRALVLRADLALELHDDVVAAGFLAGAEAQVPPG